MKKSDNTHQTPENYIKSGNARKLPIYECWLTQGFQENGIANVIVTRKHKNGNLTGAFYLVDLFCLGIKDSMFFFNTDEREYEEIILSKTFDMAKVEYNYVHNLIFGADVYAEELGLSSHKSFNLTKHILEEDTEEIDLIYFEFGDQGKPHLFISDNENRNKEIKILERKFGRDGFNVTFKDDLEEEEDFYLDEESDVEDSIPEFLEKMNDNDALFYIDDEDFPIFLSMLNIAESNESNETKENKLELLFDGLETMPEFYIHKSVDDYYNSIFPEHQALTQNIQLDLPSPEQINLDIENYPSGLSKLEDEFDLLTDELVNECETDNDFDEVNQKAIDKLAVKYKNEEAFYSFIYNEYLMEDDYEEEKEEIILKNYFTKFPNSIHAQALYLLFVCTPTLDKDLTLNKVLSKLPFKINESHFKLSKSTSKYNLTEVLNYLFLQGINHLAHKNLAKAEACLKEMVKFRAKDHPYFNILRNYLSNEKSIKIDGYIKNPSLKIIR